MPISDEVAEIMVQAAVTDAFHQKGLSREQQLAFEENGQTYKMMGVDLKEAMRAAAAALEENGWVMVKAEPAHVANE